MWKILGLLQKNLIWSIPSFMVLGLAFGYYINTNFLKSLIIPFTFLMVYPMMVTLNVKELFTKGNTKLQLTAQLLNFIVIPFLGFSIGKIFFSENHLIILDYIRITPNFSITYFRHDNLMDWFCWR